MISTWQKIPFHKQTTYDTHSTKFAKINRIFNRSQKKTDRGCDMRPHTNDIVPNNLQRNARLNSFYIVLSMYDLITQTKVKLVLSLKCILAKVKLGFVMLPFTIKFMRNKIVLHTSCLTYVLWNWGGEGTHKDHFDKLIQYSYQLLHIPDCQDINKLNNASFHLNIHVYR